MNDQLPEPKRERWQPLRSGLVNLFKYDDQVFTFEDGHLLLRGNNGTGKSRVLALQLPFLLDGDTSPERIEPDQDTHKRMEWNLLMGGVHDDRLGYTWLEFGRRHGNATEYLTVGCGMHAVQHRRSVTTWFFMTPKRVGRDLKLMDDKRRPLTQNRLSDALGDDGEVFDTAKGYRRHLDEKLFGLGEQRYAALLKLLIQLRHPQLSRKLNEHILSQALSDALPPLPDNVLNDVAEAMSSLEKEQNELEGYRAAQQSIESFLQRYRRYAQAAALRFAAPVRETHNAYENARRHYLKASEEAEAAESELAEAKQAIADKEHKQQQLQARLQTLRESPEMKSAQELTRAKEEAEQRQADVKAREQDRDEAKQKAEQHRRQAEAAQAKLDQQWETLKQTLTEADEAAKAATVGAGHAELIHKLDLPTAPDSEVIDQTVDALEEKATEQLRSARHLKGLQQAVDDCERAVQGAQRRRDDRQNEVDSALEQQREVGEALEGEITQMLESYRRWRDTLSELAPAEADDIEPALRAWVDDPTGPAAVTRAVGEAKDAVLTELANQNAELTEQRRGLTEQRAGLEQQIADLEAGQHVPPPAPHTRAEDARLGREGAPLWQLVDFKSDIAAVSRAGLEAALEASGLLDAWVMPDGQIIDTEGDAFLVCDAESGGGSETLEAVLVPTEVLPEAMPQQTVWSVLRRIGLKESEATTWVSAGGDWRVGPLHGHWLKSEPQHIGQAAREAERQRRLVDLRQQLSDCDAALQDCDSQLATIEQRRQRAHDEAGQAPDEQAIRHRLAQLEIAQSQLAKARQELTEAEQTLANKTNEYDQAVQSRDQDAQDLGLTAWVGRTEELMNNVAEYRRVLSGLRPSLHRYRDLDATAIEAEQFKDAADATLNRAAQAVEAAHRAAENARQQHEVLQASVGQDADQVLREHNDTKRELEQLEQQLNRDRDRQGQAQANRSSALERRNTASEEHQRCQAARTNAIEHLRRFATTSLFVTAGEIPGDPIDPDTEWSATHGVGIAKQIESAFEQTDGSDHAWQQLNQSLLEAIEGLKNDLGPRGYQPQHEVNEDQLHIVTVPYHSQRRSMTELAQILNDEVVNRQQLLDKREKEIIENHLIDEVAAHLHELIQHGERLVGDINKELEGRATSTGMELRFRWDIADDETGQIATARKQLLQNPGAQSQEQREALAQFLQNQIRTTRENNDLLTWRDCLSEALDYRQWHQFVVQRRAAPGEPWHKLTRQVHGTGSGGEKAIALTIPQFAAASAHYHSADPNAPRLIMLDEAFVGVDPDMRSQCMELLEQFDLDFVMTSESEWGCYPGLSGNAIYQLATQSDLDAVLCTRWVWNGYERRRDDRLDRAHEQINGSPDHDGQLIFDQQETEP